MKVLITGAKGFIGRNLIYALRNRGYNDLSYCDVDTASDILEDGVKHCDVIFHLAGVNRPEKEEEFMAGNAGFTSTLLQLLKKHDNKAKIICTSSTQVLQDNPYGKSKLAGEELLLAYAQETNADVFIFRLANVFGKWGRPNYNSVVATFCYNIANGIPIEVNNADTHLNLIYIDDVVNALIAASEDKTKPDKDGRYYVHEVYKVTLGDLALLIKDFYASRQTLKMPNMADAFTKKLYGTYLSYLPRDAFAYPLISHTDIRGSFTEIMKQESFGQISVNISKPCITKGNHWHHTKNEKFLVVSGEGVIRFKPLDPFAEQGMEGAQENEDTLIEYFVSGERMQVVDIPPGYTHNITNLGDSDMVTLMWANELFDEANQDTYYFEL